ncbi:hypothetical protein VTI74DRAFT_8846 [Chaetomium olivicolor]
MTYFFGEESAISSSSQQPPLAHHRAKEHRSVPHPEPAEHPKRAPSQLNFEKDREPVARPSSSKGTMDTLRHEGFDPSRPVSPFPRSTDTPSLSQPLTPVLLGASRPASVLSSVSSRRNSLCLSDDLPSCPPSMRGGDVAVEDDEEEEEQAEEPNAAGCSSMMDSGSAPQLIMPSIKMPSRRPFTDEGKRMGRLKVLIAGDSGVGKTSLIKAIVQSCEHIVHVDPITPSGLLASSLARSVTSTIGPAASRQKGGRRESERENTGTKEITEIYASTKPYPEWWSEVDDFRVLRRRKSLGDAVLDRNICFVDTPGYGSGSFAMDTIMPVTQYIEAHLQRIHSNMLTDGDLLNLLGGEGGVQVDAVFYMVSNRLCPVDIEYLRHLSPLTNLIILLAQADLMSAEQIAASKEQIYSQLKEANIRLFSFSMPFPSFQASSDPDKQGIYAISSAAGSDHDTMDASLLMSPDYVQPLIATELSTLVSQVFTSNGMSWLRHSVARKYVQWRKSSGTSSSSSTRPSSLTRNQTLPLTLSTASSFNRFSPSHRSPSPPGSQNQAHLIPSLPSTTSTSSYALARLQDHAQREERLAQVRLANWAADLQKSLQREREQYAQLARGERAMWLAERIGECVREGGLVVADPAKRSRLQDQHGGDVDEGVLVSASPRGRTRSRHRRRGVRLQQLEGGRERRGVKGRPDQDRPQRQDPLRLLEVADELRHKGLIALEVLGGLSVLGGLALWVTRHYLHLQGGGWLAGEWERFWFGSR